jgi:hypothetical protein
MEAERRVDARTMERRMPAPRLNTTPLAPSHQFFPDSAGYRFFLWQTVPAQNNVIYYAEQRNNCDLLCLSAVRNFRPRD